MTKRLISREIVKDIAEGMGDKRLMEKYGLSYNQLQGVFRHLADIRKKRISLLAQDIASGMLRAGLMKKYGLSPHGLTKVLSQLLAENIIRQTEIDNLRSVSENGTERREARSQIRSCSLPVVPVCETKRTLRLRELLADVREGLDDSSLMAKYRLSERDVLKVMNKLLWEGHMSPAQFEARKSIAKTVYMPIYACPLCNELQFEKRERCLRCGAAMRLANESKSKPF